MKCEHKPAQILLFPDMLRDDAASPFVIEAGINRSQNGG